MTRDLIAAVRHYHQAMNALRLDEVEAMFAADAEYHSPSVGAIVGRDAIMAAMRSYFAEYPDQVANDETMELVAPDAVRSVWNLRATAKSTGKPYVRRGVEVVRFAPSGLIRRIEVTDT